MFTCPKGHQSEAGDYCDECGTPIAAASPAAISVPAAESVRSAASATTSGALSGETTLPTSEPCPECASPRAGRFCEVCGYDFVLAHLGSSSAAAVPDAAAAAAPIVETPAATPVGWRLIVTADSAYHARMQAQADADAEPMPFPAFLPERRFDLTGAKILIGRRSRSRGIEPDVDLSGPPIDPAVSHAHALLVAQPDGGWMVVDLQSSNGTYLNGSEAALEANTPTPIKDGDVLNVGAWTALTLRSI